IKGDDIGIGLMVQELNIEAPEVVIRTKYKIDLIKILLLLFDSHLNPVTCFLRVRKFKNDFLSKEV
ncbi:MAG: hypothetical protein C0490_19380, partial [Marivirga sp.]|nr:hypothetical protein [Marivirga sp.]